MRREENSGIVVVVGVVRVVLLLTSNIEVWTASASQKNPLAAATMYVVVHALFSPRCRIEGYPIAPISADALSESRREQRSWGRLTTSQ